MATREEWECIADFPCVFIGSAFKDLDTNLFYPSLYQWPNMGRGGEMNTILISFIHLFFIIIFAVGYSDSYIDLNWRQSRAIILKAIEMPQFSLSEEVTLEDFTENYESKYKK